MMNDITVINMRSHVQLVHLIQNITRNIFRQVSSHPNSFSSTCGGGDMYRSEVGGRIRLGRGRTDEVEVENGR